MKEKVRERLEDLLDRGVISKGEIARVARINPGTLRLFRKNDPKIHPNSVQKIAAAIKVCEQKEAEVLNFDNRN